MSTNKRPVLWLLMLPTFWVLVSCGSKKEIVVFETPYGEMKAILFDETPIHRDNFLKLAKSGGFDSMLFHRVIEKFMIQTGDVATGKLGEAVDYRLEAEFMADKYFHQRGALAAARMGDEYNPRKESSGSQFYIVQGDTFDDDGLLERAKRREFLKLYGLFQRTLKNKKAPELTEKWNYHLNQYREDTTLDFGRIQEEVIFKAKPTLEKLYGDLTDPGYSDQQRKAYATIGGAPHLDGEYTVFGMVVDGLEIIDKIAAVPTNERDKPLDDLRVTVRVVTVSQQEYNELKGN